MRISPLICAVLPMILPFGSAAQAAGGHAHGGQIFQSFLLEADAGLSSQGGSVQHWDLDGWIGTNTHKLWLKSEGAREDGTLEEAEFQALYSRNVAEFWDAQAGLRYDAEPEPTAYLTFGFNGLAPYFIETEAHAFVSDEGDVTARLHHEAELLLTQRWILEPYLELNLAAQDVPAQELGEGLTDATLGLQMRYEIVRKYAPYLDLHYERKIGETAAIARSHGEASDAAVVAVGLRLLF